MSNAETSIPSLPDQETHVEVPSVVESPTDSPPPPPPPSDPSYPAGTIVLANLHPPIPRPEHSVEDAVPNSLQTNNSQDVVVDGGVSAAGELPRSADQVEAGYVKDGFESFLVAEKQKRLAEIYREIASKDGRFLEQVFAYIEVENPNGPRPITQSSLFSGWATSNTSRYLTVSDIINLYRLSKGDQRNDKFSLSCIALVSPKNGKLLPYSTRFRHFYTSDADTLFLELLFHILLYSGQVTKEDQHTVNWNNWASRKGEDAWQMHIELPSEASKAEKNKPWIGVFSWIDPPEYVTQTFSRWYAPIFYAKRPYRNGPGTQGAKIVVNLDNADIVSDALLVFSSEKNLLRFKKDLHALYRGPNISQKDTLGLWTCPHTLSSVAMVLTGQTVSDTLRFFQLADLFTRTLAFESRDQPRRSKFLQLMLLKDYIQIAVAHLNALQLTINKFPLRLQAENWIFEVEKKALDIKYLQETALSLEKEVDATLEKMQALSSIKQASIAWLLALIAGIYVPLSFISGYFGMNIADMPKGNLPNVRKFWEIAGLLTTATIVLPLLIPILLRITYLNFVRISANWKQSWPFVFSCLFYGCGASQCIISAREFPVAPKNLFIICQCPLALIIALSRTMRNDKSFKYSGWMWFFGAIICAVWAVLLPGRPDSQTWLLYYLFLVSIFIVDLCYPGIIRWQDRFRGLEVEERFTERWTSSDFALLQ